ncbi:MAG: RNA 2',3'-cyclic phosphodiesterase [Candidatus Brockarchaeota archaeon]|nr:RNA 2',3'-cyclic phosphodiesterase [Candidatus Brockarchaeota archaeon]MBO3768022.1 RNA 2',3'-cyclic phosphodiesterase [Candidatus Brockarchaeota archaeon]MBO3800761.1 RNA 2',3'-cyclic phosphodiesterase [Candidatus Brockarchaeota archaeon]
MDLENESVIRKIKEVQEEIVSIGCDVKLVEEYNFHFSLAFLGEINEIQKNEICKFLGTFDKTSTKIRLSGIGSFPSSNNPRVIWIGVSDGAELLRENAKKIWPFLEKIGIKIDKRFEPHLTIARVRSPRNKGKLVVKLAELANVDFGEVLISPIRLKKSTLTYNGPIYETLCEVGKK